MVFAVINEGRKENGKAEDEEKHQKTGEEREKQKSQRQRWPEEGAIIWKEFWLSSLPNNT